MKRYFETSSFAPKYWDKVSPVFLQQLVEFSRERPVKLSQIMPRGGKKGEKSLATSKKNKNSTIQFNQQPSTSSSQSHHNQFMDLDPEVDLSSDDQSLHALPTTVKKKTPIHSQKPPPITVEGLDYFHVSNLLINLKNDHVLKLTSFGIQIFPSHTDAFNKIKVILNSNHARYYTHALREEQLSKFVLHGYINVPESTLMNQLKELQLNPFKIKKMNVKQKRHTDHCVYLIYFKSIDKIKISHLREIKAIQHIIVKWEFYSNRRQGPIQCSNCLKFGHGGQNCFLLPRCIRCSKSHKSIECPKLFDENKMQTRTRIPDNELKCVNCGQNHAANYSKCEKRIEFVNRQKQYRNKIQSHNQNQNFNQQTKSQFQPAPQLNDFNYPQLNPQILDCQVKNGRRIGNSINKS